MKPRIEPENLQKLQERIEYRFSEEKLLKQALTHSSTSHHGFQDNERLEFLGDAILEYVICDHIYETYPNLPEGRLSEIRSVAVSSKILSRKARELGLDEVCRVSKGIRKKNKVPSSILANLFEALVAAVYKDGGIEAVKTFVLDQLSPIVSNIVRGKEEPNYKMLLQTYTQKKWDRIPHYRTEKEMGPDHDKEFSVVVLVRGEEYGPGLGGSKQEAEQEAARIAVRELEID